MNALYSESHQTLDKAVPAIRQPCFFYFLFAFPSFRALFFPSPKNANKRKREKTGEEVTMKVGPGALWHTLCVTGLARMRDA